MIEMAQAQQQADQQGFEKGKRRASPGNTTNRALDADVAARAQHDATDAVITRHRRDPAIAAKLRTIAKTQLREADNAVHIQRRSPNALNAEPPSDVVANRADGALRRGHPAAGEAGV